MNKMGASLLFGSAWSITVVWISPRLAVTGIVVAGVVYWLTPFLQAWLERWFLSSFSFIASIWKEAVVSQQRGWQETQLPPLLSTVRCSTCSKPLVECAQFCHHCGSAQSEKEAFLSCIRCSTSLPLDAMYCPQCRFTVDTFPNDEVKAFQMLPDWNKKKRMRALRLIPA